MHAVILTLVDAATVTCFVPDKAQAESVRRGFKARGITYKGTYYGPAGIVKIAIEERENGGQT